MFDLDAGRLDLAREPLSLEGLPDEQDDYDAAHPQLAPAAALGRGQLEASPRSGSGHAGAPGILWRALGEHGWGCLTLASGRLATPA
jgi:hypothetical protein